MPKTFIYQQSNAIEKFLHFNFEILTNRVWMAIQKQLVFSSELQKLVSFASNPITSPSSKTPMWRLQLLSNILFDSQIYRPISNWMMEGFGDRWSSSQTMSRETLWQLLSWNRKIWARKSSSLKNQDWANIFKMALDGKPVWPRSTSKSFQLTWAVGKSPNANSFSDSRDSRWNSALTNSKLGLKLISPEICQPLKSCWNWCEVFAKSLQQLKNLRIFRR